MKYLTRLKSAKCLPGSLPKEKNIEYKQTTGTAKTAKSPSGSFGSTMVGHILKKISAENYPQAVLQEKTIHDLKSTAIELKGANPQQLLLKNDKGGRQTHCPAFPRSGSVIAGASWDWCQSSRGKLEACSSCSWGS